MYRPGNTARHGPNSSTSLPSVTVPASGDSIGGGSDKRRPMVRWQRLRTWVDEAIHRVLVVPQEAPPTPVTFTPRLVATVAVTTLLALVLVVTTVRVPADGVGVV